MTFTNPVRVFGETKRRFVTVDLDDKGPLSCLVTLDGLHGALVTVSADQRYRLRKRARHLERTFADVPTLTALPDETRGEPSCTAGE